MLVDGDVNTLVRHPVASGLLGLVIVLSGVIALHAFGFQLRISGGPEFHVRFDTMPVLGAFHIVGSGVALLIGGFQFSRRLRARSPFAHRLIGRVYLISVLFGGIGGLAVATIADGGPVARVGFGLLGVVWLYSGWQAYAAARRRDIALHRLWMTRNFALTFAAVTLRIYLGVMTGALGMAFEDAYPVVAWLCWVPNLIVVEWFLARRMTSVAVTATGGIAPPGRSEPTGKLGG